MYLPSRPCMPPVPSRPLPITMPVPTKTLHGRPLPRIPSAWRDPLSRQSSSPSPRSPPPLPDVSPPEIRLSRPSRRSRHMLFRALNQPAILLFFLHRTSWNDFHALMSTACDLRRNVWSNEECRDVILSHFLPGYAYAMEMCSGQQQSEIHIDFHQLSLLSTSRPRTLSSPRTNQSPYPPSNLAETPFTCISYAHYTRSPYARPGPRRHQTQERLCPAILTDARTLPLRPLPSIPRA